MTRTATKVGLAALVATTLAALGRRAIRRTVPDWSGKLELPGVSAPVEVVRDPHGVPTVIAANEDDMFLAQGFLHAQDRMFQLDLIRRVGRGRLAEIVGRDGLASDRLMRTLGITHVVEEEYDQAPELTRRILDRYAAGVNAWIGSPAFRLPLEMRLLRYRPEPWQASDSLVFVRLLGLGLSGNWEAELVRTEILERFDAEVLAALDDDRWTQPGGAGGITVDEPVVNWLLRATREAVGSGQGAGIGSNAWVIAPSLTGSGGAILANDPHLDLNMPALWWECALQCPTYDVRGFSVPGAPGVALGRNRHIAWGCTNSCADVQDLFAEQPGARAGTYRDSDGTEKEYTTRSERIKVRFRRGDDEQFVVRETVRGPVITDAVDTEVTTPLSLRWDCTLRPGDLIGAMYRLNTATGWDEFRAAVSTWKSPSLNFVYADTAGNIGYQFVGQVPVRRDHDGSMPLAGDDPRGDWTGYVPFDELPSSFNPPSGVVVTANDRVVGDDYPHLLSREWMNGYRAARIRELLAESDQHTVAGQAPIHADITSIAARELLAAIRSLDPQPATAAGRALLARMDGWDCELAPESGAAHAYRALVPALQEQAYGFLGRDLFSFLGHSRSILVDGFWSVWERATPRLIRDINSGDTSLLELGARHTATAIEGWTPAADWKQLVERACDRAAEYALPDALGGVRREASDSGSVAHPWFRRRAQHRIRFAHPLGSLPGLGRLLSRGPYPLGGDPETPWQASPLNNPRNDAAVAGPTIRVTYDMSDPEAQSCVIAGGQSGAPASPQYADQIPLWLAGRTRPAPFGVESARRRARWRTELAPPR